MTTSCGCEWRRDPAFGDVLVLVRPCADHAPAPPERSCGCRRAFDPELDVEVAIEQCPEHAAESEMLEDRTARAMGDELDRAVAELARGRRVQLIWGPDRESKR